MPTPTTTRPLAARVAWLALAAFLVAFAVFEIVVHPGWPLALGASGAALPLLAPKSSRWRLLVDHWLPPLAVLLGATFLTENTDQAAGPFTLGLTWLAHVAVRRARPIGAAEPPLT